MKKNLQSMLKDLADYRRNGDSPIVVHISAITLPIFDQRNDSSTLELVWDKTVTKHTVKKLLQSIKKH